MTGQEPSTDKPELVLAQPPKPVSEMTDDELEEFARTVVRRIQPESDQ